MPFDIEGARSAGYSDAEIAGVMAQREGFDMEKATQAGYQPGDVIGFLSERSAQKAGSPPLAPSVTGSSPVGSSTPTISAADRRGPAAEGSWADPREGSWDDRGEMRKGAESAVTGLKAMAPAAKVAGSSLVISRIGERLANWDKVDKGEFVPRSEALAYQQADAAGRQKLREELLSKATQQKEFIGESVKLVKQYQQEQQRNKGATSDLTDIESVKGFSDWLAFNGAAGAVYLAPVMLSAAIGGPVGAGAMSYGLSAGEINSDRVAAAIDMNRPGRFKNPDRQQEIDQEQGIANRVASTVPSTLAFAAPNAALDVVSGPVRNVLTKPLHGLTKRETLRAAPGMIARDVVEEGVTGGLQEVGNIAAERYVGEQQGDAFTAANAKRVVNAAAAEAAGGLVGGSGHATVGLMTAPNVKTPEQSAATVLSATTVDDAIRAASAEAATPIPTPPAAAPIAAPFTLPARPEASAAVDRIGQILGQTQETPDVGRAAAVPPMDPSSGGSGLPAAAVSMAAGNGTDGTGAPAVVPGNAGTVATGSAVPQGTSGVGAGALDPQATWFGRRGDGYAHILDAEAALPSRQRARPDLEWLVKTTPEGRYSLAGYATSAQPEAATNVALPAAPAVAPLVAAPTSPVAVANPPTLEAPAAPAVPSEPYVSLGKSGPVYKGGNNARGRARQANPFKAFLAEHGMSLDLAAEFAPGQKERRGAMVQGYGPMFRKSGKPLDLLAQAAVEEGFLPSADTDRLYQMIGAAIGGERIAPLFTRDGAESEMQARIDRQRSMEETDAIAAAARLEDNELDALEDYPWEQLSKPSTLAEGLRALGATEQEIADAEAEVARERAGAQPDPVGHTEPVQAADTEAASGDRSRESQARGEGLSDENSHVQSEAGGDLPGRRDEGGKAVERDAAEVVPERVRDRVQADDGLTAPTPAEVVAQQDRRQQGERAEADRRTEEDNRARADAQRGDFTLTGSERAVDSNPAQAELSESPTTAAAPSEQKPSSGRDSQRPLIELRKRKSVLESLLTCLG